MELSLKLAFRFGPDAIVGRMRVVKLEKQGVGIGCAYMRRYTGTSSENSQKLIRARILSPEGA